jgi:hypothetical protein
MPVVMRSPDVTAMSPMGTGRAPAASLGRSERDGAGRSSTSATYVPARAQSGHVPAFGAANPQVWQR